MFENNNKSLSYLSLEMKQPNNSERAQQRVVELKEGRDLFRTERDKLRDQDDYNMDMQHKSPHFVSDSRSPSRSRQRIPTFKQSNLRMNLNDDPTINKDIRRQVEPLHNSTVSPFDPCNEASLNESSTAEISKDEHQAGLDRHFPTQARNLTLKPSRPKAKQSPTHQRHTVKVIPIPFTREQADCIIYFRFIRGFDWYRAPTVLTAFKLIFPRRRLLTTELFISQVNNDNDEVVKKIRSGERQTMPERATNYNWVLNIDREETSCGNRQLVADFHLQYLGQRSWTPKDIHQLLPPSGKESKQPSIVYRTLMDIAEVVDCALYLHFDKGFHWRNKPQIYPEIVKIFAKHYVPKEQEIQKAFEKELARLELPQSFRRSIQDAFLKGFRFCDLKPHAALGYWWVHEVDKAAVNKRKEAYSFHCAQIAERKRNSKYCDVEEGEKAGVVDHGGQQL